MKAKYESIDWSKVDPAIKKQFDSIKTDTTDFTREKAVEAFQENFDTLMELLPKAAFKKEKAIATTKSDKKKSSNFGDPKQRAPKYKEGQSIIDNSDGKKHKITNIGAWDEEKGEYRMLWGANGVGYESDVKPAKKEKEKKEPKPKVKHAIKGKSVDEISAAECLEAWRNRRASYKNSVKKAKTTPVFEKITDKVESTIEAVIKNTSDAEIKKSPAKFLKKIEDLGQAGKQFLQKFRATLGDDYDGGDIKDFEKSLDELIDKLRNRYSGKVEKKMMGGDLAGDIVSFEESKKNAIAAAKRDGDVRVIYRGENDKDFSFAKKTEYDRGISHGKRIIAIVEKNGEVIGEYTYFKKMDEKPFATRKEANDRMRKLSIEKPEVPYKVSNASGKYEIMYGERDFFDEGMENGGKMKIK